jgi:coronin-1B/1C/6
MEESMYDGEEPEEIPSDYKPRAPPSPKEVKKEPEKAKEMPQPSPVLARGPPPSMKEQTSSIAGLASKFADKDVEESDDDDDSSFEEVPKPVDRSSRQAPVATRIEQKVEPVTIQKSLDGVSEKAPKSSTPPVTATKTEAPKVISFLLHITV